MEIKQLVRHLRQVVEELKQEVLQLRQQQQQEGRATRDSVDQLVTETNWAAACSIDRQQRQSLYSVRLLRSRDPGALPCEATPAGVAAFLQCEVGSILHVERMQDNARGKQRCFVQFCTAEAAAAAGAGFRASSNAAQAVLARLQNALVDLAIQLQHIGRGQGGFEELVVLARGSKILVKRGEGELVPYPFLQHLHAGRLPNPGQPYQHLTAGRVGQQLKLLLCKPAPPAAQAPASPAPPPRASAAAGATTTRATTAAAAAAATTTRATTAAGATTTRATTAAGATTTRTTTAAGATAAGATTEAAARAPATPTKRKHQESDHPAQHQHCPPSAAGAAAHAQNLHAGASSVAKRNDDREYQEQRHNMAISDR